jgi:hypothetical protein
VQHIAQIDPHAGACRSYTDGTLDQRDRLVDKPLAVTQDAQKMQRIGLVGMHLQHGMQGLFGGLGIVGLQRFHRHLQPGIGLPGTRGNPGHGSGAQLTRPVLMFQSKVTGVPRVPLLLAGA